MFYDIFKELCNQNAETPRSVCLKLGLSQAAAPYWKKSGKLPKRETLEKIAEHFGVTVDFLLGRKNTAQAERPSGEMEKRTEREWERIVTALSPENRYLLLQYADFLLAKQALDDQEPK